MVDVADTELSRAELRRAQVLDASILCFGRSGFHGASMADIATEASMSVGQIYRYFANKEAIIAAIVERDMQEASKLRDILRQGGDGVEELIQVARYKIEHVRDPIRAALSLEILAEAARNPRVAEIVRSAEEIGRGWLREMLERRGYGQDNLLEARMDMIALLIEGWTSRVVKNPNADHEAYVASLRQILTALLVECKSGACG
ncbi:MAG TPA: TetR/AcrR family transcriptional regulator [Terricaulis sp.]|nr:TetR/AcrR family transcriptional regulator [Terricaulis sp.]